MIDIPQISDAEWQVMKVLWAESPLTANEIIKKLTDNTSWKPKTIKTLLSRLVLKNALGFSNNGREYSYFPIILQDDCIKEENKSFLKRVYSGAVNVMFANFLEDYDLSKADIEELKRILDEKKV